MNDVWIVLESDIEDQSIVAIFYKEDDANECAKYLNSFKRQFKHYYVEDYKSYNSMNDYLIDVRAK